MSIKGSMVMENNLIGNKDGHSNHCELCHRQGSENFPLFTFFADQNPANVSKDNIIKLCPPCGRHWNLANPQGIKSAKTLFAFAINRGLYTKAQIKGSQPCLL